MYINSCTASEYQNPRQAINERGVDPKYISMYRYAYLFTEFGKKQHEWKGNRSENRLDKKENRKHIRETILIQRLNFFISNFFFNRTWKNVIVNFFWLKQDETQYT